jgi:AbrB family looped-hinge helix DNA binding protein
MVKMKVYRDPKNRTSVKIPSFIRDKLNLEGGSYVDVDIEGSQIIITPIKA